MLDWPAFFVSTTVCEPATRTIAALWLVARYISSNAVTSDFIGTALVCQYYFFIIAILLAVSPRVVDESKCHHCLDTAAMASADVT